MYIWVHSYIHISNQHESTVPLWPNFQPSPSKWQWQHPHLWGPRTSTIRGWNQPSWESILIKLAWKYKETYVGWGLNQYIYICIYLFIYLYIYIYESVFFCIWKHVGWELDPSKILAPTPSVEVNALAASKKMIIPRESWTPTNKQRNGKICFWGCQVPNSHG
jgi:hypothetical protein